MISIDLCSAGRQWVRWRGADNAEAALAEIAGHAERAMIPYDYRIRDDDRTLRTLTFTQARALNASRGSQTR